MTAADYNSAGFKVSTLLTQEDINRAENSIIEAYLKPIAPNLTISNQAYKKALMNLTFMLLLKRDNVFITRAGAKTKNTPTNSQDSDAWNNLINVSTDCHLSLESLKKEEGVIKDAKIMDICGIYFKTNYINF